MIANILVVLFVALMAYYWYTQGFFSAFLHLAMVIIAGTLAFAIWEPIAHWLLNSNTVISYVAWSVSLLGSFFIILVVLRLLMDHFVPGNLQFPALANLIGGALCGVASGILTAGITVIGLGFLPLPIDLGGYQPYAIGSDGRMESTDQRLWLPADQWTSGFFTGISRGTFSPIGSDASLATHRPGLAAQAAMFRVRYDENASLVIAPAEVGIERMYQQSLPSDALPAELLSSLGREAEEANRRLVVIETALSQHTAGYDDGTIRIPPTQVKLVTYERRGGRTIAHTHPPLGFAKDDVETQQRRLYPFDTDAMIAFTADPNAVFAWAFAPPENQSPQYLQIRQVRYPLNGVPVAEEAELMRTALGRVQEEAEAEDEEEDTGPRVGEREGMRAGHVASEVEVTNSLPGALSRNHVSGFRLQGTEIVSGRGRATRHTGRLSEATRIDGIYHPREVRMVRIEIDVDQARSLFGQARAAAASLHGVRLEDHRGVEVQPIAYVAQKSSGEQEIAVDLNNPITSARQLPLANLRGEDSLYLYFVVTPGVTLERYWIGPETSQEVNLRVE